MASLALRSHRVIAVLLLFGAQAACDGPHSIEASPENLLLTGKGDSVQLDVTVKSKQGKVLRGAQTQFKSLTPTILTVDPRGTVRAVSSGTGSVLIKAGEAAREVEVMVQVPKKILIEPQSPLMMLGVTRGFKVTVLNDREQPLIAGKVRWSTSDPAVISVDARGNVKTLTEGNATLTAFAAGIKGSTSVTVKHEVLNEDGSLTQ